MVTQIKKLADNQLLEILLRLDRRIERNEDDHTDIIVYGETYGELHRRGVELPIY